MPATTPSRDEAQIRDLLAKWTRALHAKDLDALMGCWVRVTVGFQKRNGQWLVTHDHVSMPFDMETQKAVSDLRQ